MTALIGFTSAPDLHVMSFNVRRRMPASVARRADRWQLRRPSMQALLRREQPTLVGAQEALPDQAAAIGDALGPRYRFVGHGRRPGPRGEATPIFYDADRLELLDWRQQSLSDRPGEPGSVSWGNAIPRVLVRATFRDRASATAFLAVNTHWDVFSARARLRAAGELRRLVADQTLPALVTGDLNAGPASAAVTELLRERTLVDAWTAADACLTPEWGTYGGYRRPRPGQRIDWIAVSPAVSVRAAAINAEPLDGGWPSDHFPVQAVVRMPRSESA